MLLFLRKVPSEESSVHNCYTLEQTLTRLGLQQYLETLLAEDVDLESLVLHRDTLTRVHIKQHQSGCLITTLSICSLQGSLPRQRPQRLRNSSRTAEEDS